MFRNETICRCFACNIFRHNIHNSPFIIRNYVVHKTKKSRLNIASMINNNDIGRLGEDLACRYLENKGFHVKTRNYRRIFGELDIVAEKKSKIHFVEVKALEGENTLFKPEDAVNYRKQIRLKRAIKGFLREFHVSDETEWVFDIIAVLINTEKKTAKVRFLENMIL